MQKPLMLPLFQHLSHTSFSSLVKEEGEGEKEREGYFSRFVLVVLYWHKVAA